MRIFSAGVCPADDHAARRNEEGDRHRQTAEGRAGHSCSRRRRRGYGRLYAGRGALLGRRPLEVPPPFEKSRRYCKSRNNPRRGLGEAQADDGGAAALAANPLLVGAALPRGRRKAGGASPEGASLLGAREGGVAERSPHLPRNRWHARAALMARTGRSFRTEDTRHNAVIRRSDGRCSTTSRSGRARCYLRQAPVDMVMKASAWHPCWASGGHRRGREAAEKGGLTPRASYGERMNTTPPEPFRLKTASRAVFAQNAERRYSCGHQRTGFQQGNYIHKEVERMS